MNKIYCLTPIKNEAWILNNFLSAASIWADKIIIADQLSTDDSIGIAKSFKKVHIIDNRDLHFSEDTRQRLLINEARKNAEDKILIALDADEFLTPNFFSESILDKLRKAPKGTIIKAKYVNICPDLKHYWELDWYSIIGVVDDGVSQHNGKKIHSPRLPVGQSEKEIILEGVKVMHFEYVDWERMKSKHRWYQCWEKLNNPKKNPIQIYRQYHHMYLIKKYKYKVIPDEWMNKYKEAGIDLTNFIKEKIYWWDFEVVNLFHKYGINKFLECDVFDLLDKKLIIEKEFISKLNNKPLIIKYLNATKKISNTFSIIILDYIISKLFKIYGH